MSCARGSSSASRCWSSRCRSASGRTSSCSRSPTGRCPTARSLITLGVTEPFTTTLTVSAYFAIVLSLPIILYQAYAYVLPAFSAAERRSVTPLMLLAPFLFIGGAVFAYFVVLPPAIDFLLNFNDDAVHQPAAGTRVLLVLRRRC